MKVAFRISCLGFGGAERVFISIADSLRKDYDVIVEFVVDSLSGETIELVRSKKINVVSLDVDRTFKSILPLKSYIDKSKPDIIISAYTDTNAACILSSKLSRHNVKVVVSEHSSLFEHWQRKNFFKRYSLRLMVSYLYRFSDAIIGVSQGVSDQVKHMSGKQVTTIYNPIRFRNPVARSTREKCHIIRLLAVGRISEPKDYLTLIKSTLIVSTQCEVKLTIVGGVFSQPEKELLDQYIYDHSLQDVISFIPFTEHLEQYYQEADIFVLSSRWEGFGNVIVEAMSFGLPIVSTDCNHGPREILADGRYGRLVPVGDFNRLAAGIIEEFNCPLVDTAVLIMRSKDFSEEKISECYFNLFKSVIE